MRETAQQIRNGTFFVLVSVFVLLVAWVWLDGRLLGLPISAAIALALAFGFLGLILVVLTVRLEEARTRKILFLLAGASAVAMPVSAILHNLVYALFKFWFGKGFWERHGADEPFFFILAVLVCPALFVAGAVGSIALLIKARLGKGTRLHK